MKTLKDGVPGESYTVRKVTGGRENQTRFEQLGIMSGTDITLVDGAQPDGKLHIQIGKRDLYLTPEEGGSIAIARLFTREGDPILMSGCASGGSTSGVWDRINDGPEGQE